MLADWDKYNPAFICFPVYKKENKHIFFTAAQGKLKPLKRLLSM